MSIKIKLIITSVVALLLTSLILTFTSSNATTSAIENRLYESELPAVVQSVSKGVGSVLHGPIVLAQSIATNPFTIRHLKSGTLESNKSALLAYLSSISTAFKTNEAFIASKQTKEYLIDNGSDNGLLRKIASRSSNDAPWFYNLIESGKP
ncbi:hypothetical protein [Vibrio diabolicus]|uniref:Uncharacterized protein n=1 Tax=Vibrio diabolicus TaxID=50719 RepID=A0AA92R5L0_9VIBR|nr:hypothetical protein [Vibrio diabolicus]QRG81517.1 hypothetical protein JOS67_00170 [Vibrio diabolicus]